MTTNCASLSQVCALTPGPVCAASAVDTIGSNVYTQSASNSLFGTYTSVVTARTLTQIEAYFTASGTSAFVWVVYASPSATGTYSKIFETTTASTGNMFHSSGPINVSLEKGKYYFIGVVANGVTASYSYTFTLAPVSFSFGQGPVGASYAASSGAPATVPVAPISTGSYYYYLQRFTTALP